MAKSRRTMKHRKGSRKHRKAHRKGSRKAHRKSHRRMLYGGEAPVNYSNPGPMGLSLAQGQQFAGFHKDQHGGAYGPYPAAVDQATVLPADLTAAARLLPLNAAFAEIRGMSDQAGGKRRRHRKGSRKSRKGSRKGSRSAHRKQRGGVLVRWGGGSRRRYRGGAYAEMRFPMPVADEGNMLIPAGLREQANLNAEWKLAENPNSFAPLN
jgi:hypothetical protein